MSHERIKGNIFLVRKGIPKIGECHVFYTIGVGTKCFLIYLRPLSSVPKSKIGKSPAHEIGLVSIFSGFL